MNDQHKTKVQLIEELEQTRKQVAELEQAEIERKLLEKALHNLIEIIQFVEHVSTRIHGRVEEAEIYRTVKEEFAQSKQYSVSLLLLTDDDSSLRIAEASLSPEQVKEGEKATGLRMKGYKIDLKKSSIYSQVVRDGKTVQAEVSDIIGELFPRQLAHLISKTTDYEKKSSILTPLKRHGKIIGAFAMTSPELAEYFIPSVRNLAQHISKSLEWADEYTDRKRAEVVLRESERRYRQIIEEANDVIYMTDPKGYFTYFNPPAQRVTGYMPDELIGMHYTELIPQEWRVRIQQFYNQQLEDHVHDTTMEFPILNRAGEEKWVEQIVTLLTEGDRVTGFQSIVRDITERKRAEAMLEATREQLRNLSTHLQSVREEDRSKLAREIHDELGQALTALKFKLIDLKNSLPADQISLVEKANSIAEYVDTTAQTVNGITARLRPALLDELGLVEAIEWEVEQFQALTGVKCEFTTHPEKLDLDQDCSTMIYRITQEALTNVARHAQATRSTVSLELSDDELNLSITDNGIGITEEQASNPRSLGIIGMRERVLSAGGDFKIYGVQKKGTRIRVTIPIGEEKQDDAKISGSR
ncbi:MAG: PAS domain S-box protein [Candidatus Neomarinimicrobiota bacterium]